MKFADGFWLNQRGYEVNYAVQAYDVQPIENGFLVVATPFFGRERYKLLGGANLEIRFTSTQENCIKVNITHHKGYVDNGPHFVLNEGSFKPETKENDNEVILISGDTKVVISKTNWDVTYYYKDKKLTSGGWRSTGVIKESAFKQQARLAVQADDTFWSYPADEHRTYIREQLDTTVGEYFYGFGEKFTTFTKKGQKMEFPVPPAVSISVGGKALEMPAHPVWATEQNGLMDCTTYDVAVPEGVSGAISVKAPKSVAVEIDQDARIVCCTYRGKTKTFRL